MKKGGEGRREVGGRSGKTEGVTSVKLYTGGNSNGSFISRSQSLDASDGCCNASFRTYEIISKRRNQEIYSLTDQLRRSSRSVAANITEAWRKRRYPAAFVSKLSDAEAEAAESQTHIEIALRCRYISVEVAAQLDQHYEEILAMLMTMSANPDQWTLRKKSDE